MRTLLDPGEMTARLVLERPVETPDGQGGAATAFQAVTSLWARIDPVADIREETAGAERYRLTHMIWLALRSDLAAGMRLRKGSRIFMIRTCRDPDEGGRYVVCACEEDGR